MAVSVFPIAREWTAPPGFGSDAAGESLRDFCRPRFRRGGPGERFAAKISQGWRVPRPHALRKLFHDRHLPDPGARARMDLGTFARHHDLCYSRLVALTLRFDAHPKSKVNGGGEFRV